MSRSWQVFVERTLRFHDHEQLYHGVCFVDKYDRVEYSHGCFRGDHVAMTSADQWDRFDATQFRHAFDQHTRLAIQDTVAAHADRNEPRTLDAVASVSLGTVRFQVIATSFSSLRAVASGKSYGLVVERLPFGILVVVCRSPHHVEDLASIVESCCASLR